MCCSGELSEDDADGVCPDCGDPTVDGDSVNDCYYSPCICDTCNNRPCDGSC